MSNKKKRLLGASTIDWTKFDPSTLKVGDEILAPSAYGFDAIVFEVVDKDHLTVTGKDHTVTLQTKYALSNTDGSAKYKVFSDDSVWSRSIIKNYLNSTSSSGFLGAFILDSSGNQKTGDDLTQAQAFINAIQKPILSTFNRHRQDGDISTDCKVWLPSSMQLDGWSSIYDENECLDKYDSKSSETRVKTSTSLSAISYWERTECEELTHVVSVNSSGNEVETEASLLTSLAIAPCITFAYSNPTITYTVTFDSKGGSSVSSQTVNTGSVITRPSNPTKSGSTFVDWYKEETYTTVYDFSTPVTSNFTLYAKWNDAPTPTTDHTVTVDYYQGTEHKVDSQTVTHGGNATIPTNYTRTGYTFVRWDGSFTNVTEDRTITAIYSSLTPGGIGGPRKPVYIDKNGDPKECGKQLHSITVQDLGATDGPLLATIKVGDTTYTIHDKKSGSGSETVTVSFNTNGGSTVLPRSIKKGSTVTKPSPDPTYSGHIFSNWYSDAAFTTLYDFASPVTENITLYARWDYTDWTTFDPSVLTVGQELTAPSAYGFDKIVFEVVDKNNVTVAGKSNTVTLQTKFCLTTQNSEHYHRTFSDSSSQIWESSTIKTWLNTETAPTTIRGNFLGSFLLDSSGNPKTGSDLAQAQAFIAAIQKPTLKTYTSASAYNEVATCKVWLPSVKQMGGGTPTYNWGIENACLQKYTGIEGVGSNTKRAKTTTFSSNCYYWCRSAYSFYSASVWLVYTDGYLSGNRADGDYGVAPLITFAY